MISQIQRTSVPEQYLIAAGADPDTSVFFDIETNGFRPESSRLYLIGVCAHRSGGWEIHQWLCEQPEEEPVLLQSFLAFLGGFRNVIHFNGNHFDIPYLRKKVQQYNLPDPFENLCSIDLYLDFKPLRRFLSLEKMNQKSLETFLGIQRKDLYDGGQLIPVYRTFTHTKDPSLRHLLLLHNVEDVQGMGTLLRFYSYLHLAEGGFSIPEPQSCPACRQFEDALEWKLVPNLPVPVPVHVQHPVFPDAELSAAENEIRIHVPVMEGTLKYYLDSYKDYYYLPAEDMAIHKSVAAAVSPAWRKKATKETCYVKKEGLFIPCPCSFQETVFKSHLKDRSGWMTLPDLFENPKKTGDFLIGYSRALLKEFLDRPHRERFSVQEQGAAETGQP